MSKRENSMLESYKSLRENIERRENNRTKAIEEAVQNRKDFMKNYHSIIEMREAKLRNHSKLLESAKNAALSDTLKAIYITALEAGTLTDNAIILAESMVDNWIKENGGATAIFNNCKSDTYLLSRIKQIVEDAAEEEVKEVEKIADDIDDKDLDTEEESEEKKDEPKEEESKEEKKDEPPKEESEEKEDNKSDESDSENSDEEKEETSSGNDPLNTSFDDDEDDESNSDEEEIPDDPTTTADDNETDTAEDIVDDIEEVPEEDITVDGDTENNGKVFDELEKEEDIKKAIELIRQRVADAEETFIRRNAEDKKAIDELIGRISDNVKTVEDIDDEANEKSKIAQESARINRRKINDSTENRPLTIMEKMTRNLIKGITKDQVVREQYSTEDGTIDMHLAVESAKVMYGFLETINTLQLEKVDTQYIEKVLSEM